MPDLVLLSLIIKRLKYLPTMISSRIIIELEQKDEIIICVVTFVNFLKIFLRFRNLGPKIVNYISSKIINYIYMYVSYIRFKQTIT